MPANKQNQLDAFIKAIGLNAWSATILSAALNTNRIHLPVSRKSRLTTYGPNVNIEMKHIPSQYEMILHSGEFFDYTLPEKCTYRIDDIAHALANTCRFGGHSEVFYSVAQHSVHVSEIVRPKFAKHALLHDASEFILGDIPKPLKRLLHDYQQLEGYIEELIYTKFGLYPSQPPEVHRADMVMLQQEQEYFTKGWHDPNAYTLASHEEVPLTAWSPIQAEANFLARFTAIFP